MSWILGILFSKKYWLVIIDDAMDIYNVTAMLRSLSNAFYAGNVVITFHTITHLPLPVSQ